jgi:hypothetical protein
MRAALLLLLCALPAAGQDTLFRVRFEPSELPAAPDHSHPSPGPAGKGADRAGYTSGALRSSLGIVWNDDGAKDGKTVFFAQSVSVDLVMPIAIGVSSEYKEGSCPYDRTWKHELTHAKAIKDLFAGAQDDFAAALAQSQNEEPRVPTRQAPALLAPERIADFRDAVDRKLRKILRERSKTLLAAMDKDRKRKDSDAEYSKVYDECTSIEWEFKL